MEERAPYGAGSPSETFLNEIIPVMRTVIRSCVPTEQIEDLVQDAALCLFARWGDPSVRDWTGYASTIASNVCGAWHKHRYRRKSEERLGEEVDVPDLHGEIGDDQEREREARRASLAELGRVRLTEFQRAVLQLIAAGPISHKGIAKHLGRQPHHVRRALESLMTKAKSVFHPSA
jgi:RNA polymerase sigma factor (sigma-70 family)